MTKWVTFLLLLLAVLAYGLSQMRPVPSASPTPAVAENLTATPDAASTPPVEQASNDNPATSETASTANPGVSNGKAPKFGPPPSATKTPDAKPGTTGEPTKSDPFSPKARPSRPVSGSIKAVVFSESSGGASRTKFTPGTSSIYVTATPEGLKDQVELVASYRSVMNESASFSEPVASSGPARRRTFRLLPPESGWTQGPYQLVIKVKGSDQVLGIDRFEIAEESTAANSPKPRYMDLLSDPEAKEPQASFTKKNQEIFLYVDAQEVPAGTPIRSVWSAVEVDNLTAGELVAVNTTTAPGPDKDAVFTFQAPRGGFHAGSYKVDVYFDQTHVGSQAFFVQDPGQ